MKGWKMPIRIDIGVNEYIPDELGNERGNSSGHRGLDIW